MLINTCTNERLQNNGITTKWYKYMEQGLNFCNQNNTTAPSTSIQNTEYILCFGR